METIRAKGRFHAAHRQLDYDGKCAFVHGHTWRGEIVVSTEYFPRHPQTDMGIDFGVLKGIFKLLDHKMLVTSRDQLFTDGNIFDPRGVVVLPGRNPSVENVAEYCASEAVDMLAKLLPATGAQYEVQVTIQETDNNTFVLRRVVSL